MKHALIALFCLSVLYSCILPVNTNQNQTPAEQVSMYALKEDFSRNTVGWIEEKTEAHELAFKNGNYYIHSKDTSFFYTSTSPLDKSFLYGLKNFELETSFSLFQMSPKSTQLGVFFESGTLRYDFILDFSGEGRITRYNYATKNETTLAKKQLESFDHTSYANLRLHMKNNGYAFYYDEELIGEGQMNPCSWQDMRVLVSAGTDLALHHFYIVRK